MYAYVRFLEDNVTRFVETTTIKNFDPEDLKIHEKKYKVLWEEDGEYYPAAIIYVRETLEELRKVVERKRVVYPNKDLLISDYGGDSSGLESDDQELKLSKNEDKLSCIKQKKVKTLPGERTLQGDILKAFKENIEKKNYSEKPSEKTKYRQGTFIKEITSDISEPSLSSTSLLSIDYQQQKIDKLQNEVATLTQTLENKEEIIKELSKLNIELQRDVININKELINKFGGKTASIKSLDVGVEIEDEIHLGQNIFLKKVTFDSAKVTARSGAQFVKNMALAVFGASVLKKSSCTGKVSNYHKKGEQRPALDATKMRAIYDIYNYYLKHEENLSEKEIQKELKHVNAYIASKISDLNRGKRKTTKDDNGDNDVQCLENELISEQGEKETEHFTGEQGGKKTEESEQGNDELE